MPSFFEAHFLKGTEVQVWRLFWISTCLYGAAHPYNRHCYYNASCFSFFNTGTFLRSCEQESCLLWGFYFLSTAIGAGSFLFSFLAFSLLLFSFSGSLLQSACILPEIGIQCVVHVTNEIVMRVTRSVIFSFDDS